MSGAVWWAIPIGLVIASAFQTGKSKSRPVVGQITKGPRGETVLVLWTPDTGKKKRKGKGRRRR